MNEEKIRSLAEAAGISVNWKDAFGKAQTVSPGALRTILDALDLPCENEAQLKESWNRIATQNAQDRFPELITGTIRHSVNFSHDLGLHDKPYRIELEGGGHLDGRLSSGATSLPGLTVPDQPGYHRLIIENKETILAAAPLQCFSVKDALSIQDNSPDHSGKRPWGVATQLYSLRRNGDGGIGDFSGLKSAARTAARHGAATLAISPVHAMFSADPSRFSPYSPSSRLFLNVLHIDPAAVLGEDAFRQALYQSGQSALHENLEQLALIDWPRAAALKLEMLRKLYRQFIQQTPAAQTAFEEFCRKGGESLLDHARFELLHAHFTALGQEGINGYWHTWPAAYRNPRSAEVAAFSDAHADEVRFHLFLQWQAAVGLSDAQKAARDAGMPIGLIADLAVGADNGGSQAWSRQEELLNGLSIGAPPDVLNALGQSWGLVAFSPYALKARGFKPYIEMLRTAFAHAGGIRIDHALGLMRMWIVPQGADARQGAYLSYPMDDLLRLIALESWRHRAIVIGEDLGTIPEGFGERLAQAGMMGIRVLLFQREENHFTEPENWSSNAIATTTTHDTPTLAGWWEGRDIEWRTKLELREPGSSEAAEKDQRIQERGQMWQAMQKAGCADWHAPAPHPEAAPVNEAVSFLGKTAAPLAIVPLEDILGQPEQPNLPGTIDEHPNWRRRMPDTVEHLLADKEIAFRFSLLNDARSQSRE